MAMLTDAERYREIEARVDARLDRGARLPGAVLRERPRRLAFLEFEAVFSAELWEALRALARHYGDRELFLAAVEPAADAYYHTHFGAYGALVLPATMDGAAYEETVAFEPDDNPADSLAIGARVVAIASPSGGLVAWADRELEVALLALYDTAEVPAPRELPAGPGWMDARRALQVMAPAFPEQRVPTAVADALLANYPSASG
ncbi:MAG TPA: hypothetical protein VFJ82_25265 [Longimicrobium sp.]|nr:hypothetical protein [Longimicrobium sp.]